MKDAGWHVRRIQNGSIDYAHYDRLARRLRGRARQRFIAGQRDALLLILGTARDALCRSFAMLAGSTWRVCRLTASFWNVPALGPADRLRAHYDDRPGRTLL
jgi:hypothetical protein